MQILQQIKSMIASLLGLDYKSYLKAKILEVKNEYTEKIKNGSDYNSLIRNLPKEIVEEMLEDVVNEIIKVCVDEPYDEKKHKIDL